MKTRFLCRAVTLFSATVASALLSAGAASASAPPVHVSASCIGDTVSGSVQLKKPGGWPVNVSLLAKAHPSGSFVGSAQQSLSAAGSEASFSFDVSKLDAFAYRVDAAGVQGRVMPAASCAPGHQVPEAPAAVLLPLSLLLLGVATLARNRRRRRAIA